MIALASCKKDDEPHVDPEVAALKQRVAPLVEKHRVQLTTLFAAMAAAGRDAIDDAIDDAIVAYAATPVTPK